MAEKREREARAVPESERMATGPAMGRGETMGSVTPMERPMAEVRPAWYNRISWGAVFAGVLTALATQLVLSALGILVGFGTANVTSINALRDVSAGVGIWTAISALISLFIGGYVASRIANVMFSSDGLWHGLTVWSLALVGSILLGTLGVTGLLGFIGNVADAFQGILPGAVSPQVSPQDLETAADVAASSAGYFLLGSLLGLAAALLGGWLGSRRMSREEAMMTETGRERMAA